MEGNGAGGLGISEGDGVAEIFGGATISGMPILSTTAGAVSAIDSLTGLGMSVTCPPHNGQKDLSQSMTLLQRLHFFISKLPFGGLSLLQNYVVRIAFIIYHTSEIQINSGQHGWFHILSEKKPPPDTVVRFTAALGENEPE